MACMSAVLAPLTCVSISATSLVSLPSREAGQNSCSSWLYHQVHWIGVPPPSATPPPPGSQPLAVTVSNGGGDQNYPAFSQTSCYRQSMNSLSLLSPHLGWGNLARQRVPVPTCPSREAGVRRVRPGPFLNHPLLPSPHRKPRGFLPFLFPSSFLRLSLDFAD